MGISTIASVVSANGRLFSIEDRSPPDNPFLPGEFTYVARDAFNGRTLWTRKIERWESITIYIKSLPVQQQRRMVATDDVLYCTPVLEGPLAALDAATGETVRIYEDISPVQEVAYDQGILFVNVGERFNSAAYHLTDKKNSGPTGTEGEPFHGGGFRRGYAPEIKDKPVSSSVLIALDPESGSQLWKTDNLLQYTAASLAVKGENAVYQTADGMFCIDPKTGEERWSVKKPITNPTGHDSRTPGTVPNTVIITDDKAFAVESKGLVAYSLKDGKELWTADAAMNYQASPDVYYLDGRVWVGGSAQPKAYDAETGSEVKNLKQLVTTPMGHDRCYRNLITERYYINSKTGGADFLNLETGAEHPNHWTRGTCGMGVLPANGLLYSTPYSCSCNVGDMVPGMNAYCGDPELLETRDAGAIKREVRLEKGPAYGKISNAQAGADSDWPTYRGNPFRGGITKAAVPARLEVKWQTKLPTSPTAPIIAAGKLFACDIDTHTLYALDSMSGKTLWTFTADARVDSPPTYHKGMVLFGSRDGWLYCVNAEDGELSWRFKDLPDRLISVYGQLESAWPVFGAVLVQDGKVYAAAGRSSFLDGGIFLYCLDPVTGKLLNSSSVYGPFMEKTGFPFAVQSTGTKGTSVGPSGGKGKRRGKAEEKAVEKTEPDYGPNPTTPGFKNGILVSDGEYIYIRHKAFDMDLANVDEGGNPHLLPLSGFLDSQVQHRTGFIMANSFKWWQKGTQDIMVADGESTYGVLGFPSVHNHSYFDPRTSSYQLIGNGTSISLPINGRAIAKAGDVIFVAGEPMKFANPTWQNYAAAYRGNLGGRLVAVSAASGKQIAEYELDAAPVWDSIAVAQNQLFLSLADGTIQCMREQK
jgi:outer membrane protein assembly factor BamB